jgi:TonB family protein
MSDRKPCVHCGRTIDAYAVRCVYCNGDQSAPKAVVAEATPAVTAAGAQAFAAPAYAPPRDNRFRNRALGAIGFVVLVVVAFSVGTMFHRFGVHDVRVNDKAATTPPTADTGPTQANPAPARGDITVVPASGGIGLPADAPITSAPATTTAQGVPGEYQRNDATAATSEEYAQLAARAKAERQNNVGVDPRTIAGSPYAGVPARRPLRPQTQRPVQQQAFNIPMTSAAPAPPAGEPQPARVVVRTRPVPQYQPIPRIRVSRNSTARLDLTVGADGAVKDVNVLEGLPGQTPQLIAAVQSWRFKPATENGQPVQEHFTVDISFHAH